MDTLIRLINQFKFLKLRRMLKDFNKPGEGGIVATLLKTKHGESVLLTYNEEQAGPALNYKLYTVHWGKLNQSLMNLFLTEHSLQIKDIQVLEHRNKPHIKKYGKGYGSIFMTYLIKEAEKRSLKTITGDMIYENDEQKRRQISFYKKYGFNIDDDYKLLKTL